MSPHGFGVSNSDPLSILCFFSLSLPSSISTEPPCLTHLCLLHWSLSSQLHFPAFPFPKTCLHFSFPIAPHLPVSVPHSLGLCPLPLGLGPLPLGFCASLLGLLSPFFFWSVYRPPIAAAPSLGLHPPPSGSLSTPISVLPCFSGSLPASLSSCPARPLYPCLSAVCPPHPSPVSLPSNLLPKPH